jgi:hypothetical protein
MVTDTHAANVKNVSETNEKLTIGAMNQLLLVTVGDYQQNGTKTPVATRVKFHELGD